MTRLRDRRGKMCPGERPALVARIEPRLPLRAPALLRREGQPDLPLTLLDVSLGGVRGASDGVVRIGGAVVLVLPGIGALPARVRWALGAEAGYKFDERLTSRRLSRLFAAVGKAALAPDAG